MARPETIDCEVCAKTVEVAPRGRVPRFCEDHSAADLPKFTEGGMVSGPEAVMVGAGEVVKPEQDPDAWAETANDGFPKQIAPVVWIDQDGNRFNDSGDAHRACVAWRLAHK